MKSYNKLDVLLDQTEMEFPQLVTIPGTLEIMLVTWKEILELSLIIAMLGMELYNIQVPTLIILLTAESNMTFLIITILACKTKT